MKTKNILFIVEGTNDEPRFVKQLFTKCFPSTKYNIYSYEANLHMLANRLEKDYPDFEEDEIDLLLFLKSYEKEQNEIFDLKYTDIFLIFDFEPQHPNLHFDTIRKMIHYFNQSDDRGKLFINYPMMQSYRHLTTLPSDNFMKSSLYKNEFNNYKEIVSNNSFNNDVCTYDYTIFTSLAFHHLTKLLFIQNEVLSTPSIFNYERLNYLKIFDIQVNNLESDFIWIVNTSIMIMVDYKPTTFFNQITTHKTKFLLPHIEQASLLH